MQGRLLSDVVTSGLAVTRPEHGPLGFLRLDWLVNERIGDCASTEYETG
jgi:hypothetical protein